MNTGFRIHGKKQIAATSVVATISLMCLLNGHQIEHGNEIRFFVNLENNSVCSSDVHTIDLHFGMQTFYIRSVVRIFKFTDVIKNMTPDLFRIFPEGLNNALLNYDFH